MSEELSRVCSLRTEKMMPADNLFTKHPFLAAIGTDRDRIRRVTSETHQPQHRTDTAPGEIKVWRQSSRPVSLQEDLN
jgi:hypothetical protein